MALSSRAAARAPLALGLPVVWLTAVCLTATGLPGCAMGGGRGDAGGGGRVDAGPGQDGGARDSGPFEGCGEGQHECGGGCVDDLPNEPENGCRLGCGLPCTSPPDGTAGCGADGQCTVGCEPPFRLEGGACVCARQTCADLGAMCGAPDDGCGTPLDCGACAGGGTCTAGMCECDAGPNEPNETRAAAPVIASMTDAPNSNEVFSSFAISAMSDEDWFAVTVADDFDAGNPQITVTLRNAPAGDDYDLVAHYVCDAGGDSTSCTQGTPDTSVARGCASRTGGDETVELATECSSTDDGGSLFVHIAPRTVSGACGTYELEIDVR